MGEGAEGDIGAGNENMNRPAEIKSKEASLNTPKSIITCYNLVRKSRGKLSCSQAHQALLSHYFCLC